MANKKKENNKEVKINEQFKNWVEALKKEKYNETITFSLEGYGDVNIKLHIDTTDRYLYIKDVMDLVFSDGNSYTVYNPENIELALKSRAIAYYTDLPQITDVYDAYAVALTSGLYEKVKEIAGKELDNLEEAALEKIEAKKDYLVCKTDWNTLITKISDFLNESKGALDNIDFGKLQEMLGTAQGFSADELVKAVVDNLNIVDGTPSGIEK